MAKHVEAIATFIGTTDEVANHGGKIPDNLKEREDKMSDGEKDSFKGKISLGTQFYVSDSRAKELAGQGLVKVLSDADGDDEKMPQAQGLTSQKTGDITTANEKKNMNPSQSKSANAGPGKPATKDASGASLATEPATKGTPE